MNKLNFDNGFEQIMINEGNIISWNPTDVDFGSRYFKFIDDAEELIDKIQNEPKAASDERETAARVTGFGCKVCEMIDDVFGSAISQAVFCGANPFSPTKNGGFLLINFLEAITPIISDSIERAQKDSQVQIKKYTNPVSKRVMN